MSFYVEQIKTRINISQIVASKVSLKSRSVGEFLGLCPFHQEKTPSFTVSDNKGFYHCFGCGIHGDIFSFLMESEGCDYRTALTHLASIAGVELPSFKKEEYNRANILYEIFENVAAIYSQNLYARHGKEALRYIFNRGISEETLKRYRLGFASMERESLIDELKKKFPLKMIEQAGIFSLKDGARLVDPMRGRLIFPIADHAGKIIAFGGRSLNDSNQPKYLNSRENPLFEKSNVLYGMHIARNFIHKNKEAIVVEGYMDVISLAEHGIYNAVAPLGIGIRAKHIDNLWRSVGKIVVCMDSDKAGQNAAFRVACEIIPSINPNHTLNFLDLGDAKDPDEFIKSQGQAAFVKLLKDSTNLSKYLFRHLKKNMQDNSPESKSLLRQELMDLAQKISNHAVRLEYKNFFNNQLFLLNANGYSKKQNAMHASENELSTYLKKMPSHHSYHALVALYIVAKQPQLLEEEDIYDAIIRLDISDEKLDKIRAFLLNQQEPCNNHALAELLEELEFVSGVVDSQMMGSSHRTTLMRALELHSLQILKQQIVDAERDLINNESEFAFTRLQSLKKHELELKKRLGII